MLTVRYVTANRHDWIGTTKTATKPDLSVGTIVRPEGADRDYRIDTTWRGADEWDEVTVVCSEVAGRK